MVVLKGKMLTASFVMVALTLLLAVPVQAFPDIGIYGYVDKTQYGYGEAGKLKVWVLNTGTDPLILHNITVYYPWHMVLPWEGNFSLLDIDEVIPVGGNKSYTFDFTVPDDRGMLSSAYGTSEINVLVVTDKRVENDDIPMSIANPPVSMALHNMDNLIILITVLIIVAIIAAIIIAAAVFLSGRRPATTWTKEE